MLGSKQRRAAALIGWTQVSSQTKRDIGSILKDEWKEVAPTIYERRDRNSVESVRWNSRPDELLERAAKPKRVLARD
jgi:hypothetical protein